MRMFWLPAACILAACIWGCDTGPGVPGRIDGRYESGFLVGEAPDSGAGVFSKSLRKDMLILSGDSLRYFVCTYEIPVREGVPGGDTLREVQLSAGSYVITADAMYMTFAEYGRMDSFPPGEVWLDTLDIPLEPSSWKVKFPVKRSEDRIEIEFDMDSDKRFVPFLRRDRLAL